MKEKSILRTFLIDVLDGVGNVFQDVRSATIHVRYGCTHSKMSTLQLIIIVIYR